MPRRPPFLSVGLISAAALAYEILLMRLFSIIQWHHFSYMVIGLALLGYGISGTLVSLLQQLLIRHFRVVYTASLLLFGISSVIAFMVAQSLPFNAEMILWDAHQFIYLLLIFVLLSIPFLFAATAICLAFMQYGEHVGSIYAWDLAGAGVGSLLVIGLLYLLFPQHALIVIGLLGLMATLLAWFELRMQHFAWIGGAVLVGTVLLILTGLNIDLNMSPYKGLPQMLRVAGTEVIERDSSPYGLISIVASRKIPFRHAPGLSLSSTVEPLPQRAIFTDGDGMTVMTRKAESRDQLAYLDQVTSALPYHLSNPQRVLIVGAGGGADILLARYHEVPFIDAVELNPQLVDIVGRRYRAFTGDLFHQPGIAVHAGDVRGFLTGTDRQYDLIQLPLLDAFNASSSGLFALNEDYTYTVEALRLYLDHLKPGGWLAMTRWVKVPPRDSLKLVATAIETLKSKGVEHPAERLALIRGWQTSTLLVRNGIITAQDTAAIRSFTDPLSFDIVHAPGMTAPVDEYNRLQQDWFREGVSALLSNDAARYMNNYKFDLRPATDDRPYFHHFSKWTTLLEVFKLRDRGGMSFIEWGYVVLVMSLLLATIISIGLIVLPLRLLPRPTDTGGMSRPRVVLYFLAIGIAFLFLEIALMQRFVLFLHNPVYAFAVSLAAFLVFAGIGSQWSVWLSHGHSPVWILGMPVTGIVLICAIYLLALDGLFASLASASIVFKAMVTIMLIAPLALMMGMPFPIALSELARYAPDFTPWAWGINGCASVISASLATLLAIHFGFSAVIVLAMVLYGMVALVFPRAETSAT